MDWVFVIGRINHIAIFLFLQRKNLFKQPFGKEEAYVKVDEAPKIISPSPLLNRANSAPSKDRVTSSVSF